MKKSYFVELAEYNIWANKKINAWLREINEEQWNRELNGSFPSISKTAIHIAAAEKIWLDRLEGFKTKFLSDIFYFEYRFHQARSAK